MYEAFYGLHSRPFLTVPDPDALYWSDDHFGAFTMLRYGIMSRAPITVVTGDIGAGKTTLVRRLLGELPEALSVGLVSNMQEGRGDLLHWIMMALDQAFEDELYVVLFRRFQDFVVDAYARGRRVVLIIDEAQNLGVTALEELRMLSNINADGNELLQIILVGQPQLRELLSRPELVQFAQRVSADYHLSPLKVDDVAKYIDTRLRVAGAERTIFLPRTATLIHGVTRGVPRLINIVCDLCLVYGYADERETIDEDLLRDFLDSARSRGIFNQFVQLPDTPTLVRKSV